MLLFYIIIDTSICTCLSLVKNSKYILSAPYPEPRLARQSGSPLRQPGLVDDRTAMLIPRTSNVPGRSDGQANMVVSAVGVAFRERSGRHEAR